MNKGWISINRKIQSHWLWVEKREFSKLEAWIDILLTVNHSEQKVMIKNTLFTVKRGDSIQSLDTWAKRWNWNKSKVRRFFMLLENDSMIVTKNESKTTRLTVCNYDSYQDMRNDNETIMKHKRNDNETIMTPNNNDNNINKENNVNKKDIEDRKTEFKNSLSTFLNNYSKDLLNDFFKYWTEHGEKDKKMRFEKEKSFGISRRLETWKRNQEKFDSKKIEKKQTGAEAFKNLVYGSISEIH